MQLPYGITPAMKEAIALEVHRQIALEKAEATGYQASAPAFLDGNRHVFVVTNETTANAGNQACSLSGGDVVQLDGASSVNGGDATVQVVASKGQDCQSGSYVGVTLAQLQEMQNGMRESIDEGMAACNQQGQNGLPPLRWECRRVRTPLSKQPAARAGMPAGRLFFALRLTLLLSFFGRGFGPFGSPVGARRTGPRLRVVLARPVVILRRKPLRRSPDGPSPDRGVRCGRPPCRKAPRAPCTSKPVSICRRGPRDFPRA